MKNGHLFIVTSCIAPQIVNGLAYLRLANDIFEYQETKAMIKIKQLLVGGCVDIKTQHVPLAIIRHILF